jgi:hypothetical protein
LDQAVQLRPDAGPNARPRSAQYIRARKKQIPISSLADVFADPFEQGLAGAGGGLVAHENTDIGELLPFAVERQERADFNEAGGDVE